MPLAKALEIFLRVAIRKKKTSMQAKHNDHNETTFPMSKLARSKILATTRAPSGIQ